MATNQVHIGKSRTGRNSVHVGFFAVEEDRMALEWDYNPLEKDSSFAVKVKEANYIQQVKSKYVLSA